MSYNSYLDQVGIQGFWESLIKLEKERKILRVVLFST